MSGIGVESRSLRSERLRANAPRVCFYLVVAVLCLAGLRAILAGTPAESVQASQAPASRTAAPAAEGFAELFTHAYLTWDSDDPDERQRRLAPFLSDSLDQDAGLSPGDGTSQEVLWTTVAGVRHAGERTLVTVMAETSAGLVNLTVPVTRGRGGALSLAGYPAVVGPPAIDPDTRFETDTGNDVEEPGLRTVAERALTNYLARSQGNLAADLTDDAEVSLPDRSMSVVETTDVSWVVPQRRVAVVLEAEDEEGTSWTLRYELDVELSDRWYVRSIHINPKSGGTR